MSRAKRFVSSNAHPFVVLLVANSILVLNILSRQGAEAWGLPAPHRVCSQVYSSSFTYTPQTMSSKFFQQPAPFESKVGDDTIQQLMKILNMEYLRKM